MATIPMQTARRRRGGLRRVAVSLFAVATLMAIGAPAGAAPPPNPNNAPCGGTLMQSAHPSASRGPRVGVIEPPGEAQSQIKFERFGSTIVSPVARQRGSFDECLDALLEILENLP